MKIISKETFDVDETHLFEGKTWWEYRPAMIQVPSSSWAKIKEYMIKSCKKYHNCENEIESWDRSLQKEK